MKIEPINAVGIFQGGGVKVSGYIGAIKACEENKINFIHTAGTSGGSIIASLLSVGYTYNDLKNIFDNLDFENLITKITKPVPYTKSYKINCIIASIIKNKFNFDIQIALNNYGLFSLSPLELLLNKLFKEKIPVSKYNYIIFSDLPTPLTVITTDLSTGKIRIYSKDKTPEESVAKAVIASCSIPIIMQPVVDNYSFLVDGGIISNLPISIVINEIKKKKVRSYPVLAFLTTSKTNTKRNSQWTVPKYLSKLIDVIVDGNVEIQKINLDDNTHLIEIDTDDIQATDFNQMTVENKTKLHKNGYESCKQYLTSNVILKSIYNTKEKVVFGQEPIYTLIQSLIQECQNNITFILDDFGEKITYQMLLSLVITRMKGKNISFIYYPPANETKSRNFTKLLTQIGVTVITKPNGTKLPFKGIILDHETQFQCLALLDSTEDSNDYCVLFKDWHDKQVLSKFLEISSPLFSEIKSVQNNYVPKIETCLISDIISLYKEIEFYKSSKIEISLKEINPNASIPHTKYVKEFKQNQINYFRNYLAERQFDYYIPLNIILKNGKKSIINPPVLEVKNDGSYHITEGHNRIFYSKILKETKIKVIAIKNVEFELPSKSYNWNEVEILSNKSDEEDTNKDNIHALLRRIETITHKREDWE